MSPGQVIVDLGRMNRIVSIDRELGYAVIEPGVTQAQLAARLAQEDLRYWLDCTGASPHSSLIGNILERGFGHTPYGNRLLTVSGLEVVLGTGEVVQTGFGHFVDAKAAHLFPYGVGPYLDGLFTQSNFGIVTRVDLWLLPKPGVFRPFLCFFAEDEDFLRCIEPLRELRMQRVLQSVGHVANDLRAISGERSFPRDLVPTGARLPEGVRLGLRRLYEVGAWTLTGALYGPTAEVRVQRAGRFEPTRSKLVRFGWAWLPISGMRATVPAEQTVPQEADEIGSDMADLRRVCEEWAGVLGTENIVTDARLLAEREAMTFALRRRIPVILRPGRVGEVQACMRIANARGVPVYPVSSGRNWGYGSSAPSADGCALLDLSRMNAILDYNEDLAYVTVEPGVTQRQLFDFLASRGAKLWMDATGSSPDCSLVGNTVERGFGHTPYGDHFANSCAYEVVLPTGERAQTGFRQLPDARAGQAYRWGVGPVIDGLFTQSNLGIVTRMTIWLMPAPEAFQAFFFKADQDEGLEGLIGALRTLRLEGTLRSAVHIGNDYRVLTSIGQYPWEDAKGAPPLPADVLGALAQRHEFGAWNGSGALYGTPAQVRAARARVRAVLGPHVDRVRFLDDRLLRVARRYQGVYRRLTGLNLREVLALVEPVYGLMKGIPTSAMLASTYWRKRVPAPANPDPDRDRCGLLWCAPVAPADPRPVREMVTLIREVFSRHPFEPALSMTLRTERSVDSVVSINYDRDVPGEDERAMQCHDELLGRLSRSGFYPYRLGLQSLDKLPPRDEGSAALLKAIKAALDPNQVLAPGRYL